MKEIKSAKPSKTVASLAPLLNVVMSFGELRPEWKAYLLELRKQKGKSELVLFLKWDRSAVMRGMPIR